MLPLILDNDLIVLNSREKVDPHGEGLSRWHLRRKFLVLGKQPF